MAGLGEKVDASRKRRPPPPKGNPGPAIDSALLQRGIAHWSLITAGKRRQTPPPHEMATEAGGTHPTGMHSCFWVYPTTSDISSLRLVMSIMSLGRRVPSKATDTDGIKLNKPIKINIENGQN